MRQMARIMCQMSGVTCHMSLVTCHQPISKKNSFLYIVIKLVGGGSVINRATPINLNPNHFEIAALTQKLSNSKNGVGKQLYFAKEKS